MATTRTASLATSNAPVPGVHTGGVIQGKYEGAGLSASGSALLFLCKIPASCNVSIVETHVSGSATQVLNVGVRGGNSTSVSVSALMGAAAASAADNANFGGPYTTTWDQTAGETFKYVVASLQSGTVTASMNVYFSVFYQPN